MANIPVTRSQFLLPFLGILDEIGAPTNSLLGKFRLPSFLETKSNLYIPLLPTIRFVETAQRSQGITDFGFLASKRLHFSHLNEKTRALIAHSPTLLVALRHACNWASREDTILNMWMEWDSDHVRVCSRLARTNGLLHLEHSQWLQNIFSIYIVRQFTGPNWIPATIAFQARYTPGAETQSLWPNVRFLSDQHAAWISVPISCLGLSNRSVASNPPPHDHEDGPSGYDIVEILKMMLPSYLDQGVPTLAEVAEMAGVSTRTFQRKLSHVDLTYSDILDTIRFESASTLLRDSDSKIIDVAFAAGYADPAHFSRAFRRIAGVTPRQFREQSRLG
ncbi:MULTISPECIES: helix-turn-helix transcriptional regulator [Agrobacterium]|uniref:AraC-like DNA-binding protein n=1 Tax=Agrobacterium tumefaciens TaxID=358 RepID=A0AAW8M2P6_AGRTU|nr:MULTISPECIES: helix-turn-helix transcriptional regulator [Agrobacterium]MBP2511668.1 AraC-like DNA-binding protein [Agrobacterium tumefaciens]MBP2520844.1 AraC-like DNA-binding protein [Agrobacterium tumefaciens]MBP2537575.1 AraC-like DNA-binding protein [Agrobacterium tumefaciens]MBP2542746.1 AraC-like DNA-binding protein [Agrobacterium tumefaciens]MBP2568797.1 AraC-like DNA-binding protein [Agrobacterium tumefaciens]